MNRAVIGLGSNIESELNIVEAKAALARQVHVMAESALERTKPVGNAAQPDFLNGTVLIETTLGRQELKAELRRIETQLGRAAEHDHDAPRTIDLDIIVWNESVIDPDFYERDYLKRSVLEIMPDLMDT